MAIYIECAISAGTTLVVATAFFFQYFAPKSEVLNLTTQCNAQALKITKLQAEMSHVNKLLEKLSLDSEQHGLALAKILSILEGMNHK